MIESVHQPRKPGRNDPCWCGSGKKYKKCHLAEDEQSRPGGQTLRPQARSLLELSVGRFLDGLSGKKVQSAFAAFTGAMEEIGATWGDRETDEPTFTDWMMRDWRSGPLKGTILDEFLHRHGNELDENARREVGSWRESHIRLVEVVEVNPGAGLRVRDRVDGKEFRLKDRRLSESVVRWDTMLLRIQAAGDGFEATGVGVHVFYASAPALLQWIADRMEESNLSWPQFAKQFLPEIYWQNVEADERRPAAAQFVTTGGEELEISEAVWDVSDCAALVQAFENEGFHQEEGALGEPVFPLLERSPENSPSARVLGVFRLEGDLLKLETMTRGRLGHGKALVESFAGALLMHRGDSFNSLHHFESEPPSSRPVPPGRLVQEETMDLEHELLRQHYRKWPDVPLPALDGETPRQAVRKPELRGRLVELLKFIENGELRKRRMGVAAYDVEEIRRELGLADG